MTPLERLLAETIPTGTFGGPRPEAPCPVPAVRARAGPDPRAAEHLATLTAELTAAGRVDAEIRAARRADARERIAVEPGVRYLRAVPATADRKAAS